MDTPPSAPSTAVHLQLVSCRGVASSAVLPLGGQACSLQAVAALSSVAVPADTQVALQQCRVEPAEDSVGTPWWLRNLGSAQRCTVNASALGAGETVPLQDGDLIELGLVQIVFRTGTSRPAATSAAATTVASLSPSPASGIPAFRLTDLVQQAQPAAWQAAFVAQDDAPFADIVDAFDGLGAGLSPPFSVPLPQEPAAAQAHDGPEPALPADGVMDHLHQQYLRLMRSPHDPQMAGRWATQEVAVRSQAPGFDELRRQAASRDLYDILGHSAAIDPILQGLDTLSESDILRPAARVDVLRLFAPAERPHADAALPGLTRSDHHRTTADSAMRLQAGTAEPAAPFPQHQVRP